MEIQVSIYKSASMYSWSTVKSEYSYILVFVCAQNTLRIILTNCISFALFTTAWSTILCEVWLHGRVYVTILHYKELNVFHSL